MTVPRPSPSPEVRSMHEPPRARRPWSLPYTHSHFAGHGLVLSVRRRDMPICEEGLGLLAYAGNLPASWATACPSQRACLSLPAFEHRY